MIRFAHSGRSIIHRQSTSPLFAELEQRAGRSARSNLLRDVVPTHISQSQNNFCATLRSAPPSTSSSQAHLAAPDQRPIHQARIRKLSIVFPFFAISELVDSIACEQRFPWLVCLQSKKMRRRPGSSSSTAGPSGTKEARAGEDVDGSPRAANPRRSPFVWLTLFGLIMYCSWAVYRCQFESLPAPLTAEQAGKRGFSEVEAMKHVKALTDIGPHHVGSDALDDAIQVLLLLDECCCFQNVLAGACSVIGSSR